MMSNWAEYAGCSAKDWQLDSFLGVHDQIAGFLAHDSRGTESVLQLLDPDAPHADATVESWKLASQWSHRHLLKVLECGTADVSGVKMQFAALERPDLDVGEIVEERALEPDEASALALGVATALDHLHRRGISHGAVRATNVVIVGEDVKLAVDTLARSDDDAIAADLEQYGAMLVETLTGRRHADAEDLPQPYRDIAKGCLEATRRRWTAARVLAALEGRAYAEPEPEPVPTPVLAPPPPVNEWHEEAPPERMPEHRSQALPIEPPETVLPTDPEPPLVAPAISQAEAEQVMAEPPAVPVAAPGAFHLPELERIRAARESRDVFSEPPEEGASKKWLAIGGVGVAVVLLGGYWMTRGPEAKTAAPVPTASAPAPAPAQAKPTPEETKPAPPHKMTRAERRAAEAEKRRQAKAEKAAKKAAAAPAPAPAAGGWAVIAATYNQYDQAKHRAGVIKKAAPQLEPDVYPAKGQRGPFYVVLGTGLAQGEAEKLRDRARRQGAPRDTYMTKLKR